MHSNSKSKGQGTVSSKRANHGNNHQHHGQGSSQSGLAQQNAQNRARSVNQMNQNPAAPAHGSQTKGKQRQSSTTNQQALMQTYNLALANNSSHGFNNNASTTNSGTMRAVALNKRFAFNQEAVTSGGQVQMQNHQTMGFENQNPSMGYHDLNQTSQYQQNQLNTLIADQRLQKQKALNSVKGQTKIQIPNHPVTTQNNSRRNKHSKAFSMVQSTRAANQPQQTSINNSTFSGRALITEQYLNQPLRVNQKIANQNMAQSNAANTQQQQQMMKNQFMNQLATLQTPNNFNNKLNYNNTTIDNLSNQIQLTSQQQHLHQQFQQYQAMETNSNFNLSQLMSPQSIPANGNQDHMRALSLNDTTKLANMSGLQNQTYSFIPPPNKVPVTNKAASSNRLPNGNLNNSSIASHARSYSNCSKRDFHTISAIKVSNQPGNSASGAISQPKNNISEAQLLESEEHFESGKVLLSDKKYKEAVKLFTKSLNLNKQNYDALFYRGVTHLDQGQPAKAIQDLNELQEICPDYRKTMFIVLSIAYRRMNDYTGALRTLSKAILRYQRYIEAYIARGQIYIFQKKWDKALSDFRVVIQLQPENGMGYLGQGDSLKGIGNCNGALQSYTKAIEIDEQTITQGLMKRGLLYLQMKLSEKALEDFNQLTDLAEESNQPVASISGAYFYKAKALKKLNNFNDAILYFEQVIRQNDDNYLSSSSLYEIAKIKIQQKDFYEAYYNLKRATHYKLKQKKLVNYKMFTEAVIFLMKRKTKTGLKIITQLIERMKPTSPNQPNDYIYNLVYTYRAYGYFVTDEFDKSLKDYIKSNSIKKLNVPANYNMILCQGLKCIEQKEYENAISFFTKASQKLPKNRDPYYLRAISLVKYALFKPIKPKTKTKMLKDAKRDLNRALANSPKDYQVIFLKGILNFALHYFYDAITDFESVIEKSEDTNAKYYLARGRCYACLSMFKEAITDLSIAINLNKDLLDAYLNRGKCAYLIGDTGLAFMDFQKLIVLEPKNPMVHIYAGNLLMTTGSYEDATKAFTNADNIQKSSLALYQRSRCRVALNQMLEALKDLNKVIEISSTDKVAIADKECLNALKISSHIGTDKPTTPPHEKAVYEKAVVILTKLISYENNEHLAKINHDSSIVHQHSQMIPSAHRTKTDKIRAIRRRKEQDRLVKEGKAKRNDLRFRVHQSADDEEEDYEDLSDLDEQELEKLNRQLEAGSNATQGADVSVDDNKEEETNYYKENIFNKEDYYLYRAVMNTYAGDYEKGIQDFEQSSSIMHMNKVLYPKNQFNSEDSFGQSGNGDDNASNASSQTDLSDVGLCSLNIHEYSYNTVLCLIMMKDYEKALTKLDYMFDTIPKKYSGQLWIIRGAVHQALGNHQAAKKDFRRAHKHEKENAQKFCEKKESVYLTVFPQQQRLCNWFAYIKTPLSNGPVSIHLKPSFSFPFIKPPNMIPCVDKNVLDQFEVNAVPLKPEAPWIKKCQFGIKFTDEIYYTDDDREATPEDEKEYKKRKQRQQQRAMEAVFFKSYSEKILLKTNIFKEDEEEQQEQAAVDAELIKQYQEQEAQQQQQQQQIDTSNQVHDVRRSNNKHQGVVLPTGNATATNAKSKKPQEGLVPAIENHNDDQYEDDMYEEDYDDDDIDEVDIEVEEEGDDPNHDEINQHY